LSPTPIHLVGSPLKLSDTSVDYRLPPPICGQHTRDILHGVLQMDDADIQTLITRNIVDQH
jgi:crotonobetainyl-CoA:carnitine CoA-transferase CaiB-like acyl-CoA transferase